jgi:hypothetical protein
MRNTILGGWLAWYRAVLKRTIMNHRPNEKAPFLGRIGAYQYWPEQYLEEKEGAKNLYESTLFFRNAMIYAMIGGRLGFESLRGRLHPANI